MKKFQLLFVFAISFIAFSCTKEYPVPVVTPESNTWVVNTETFGPASFKYYDTAGLMYGGIMGKASVTIKFRFKPKADGKYVLREKSDEYDEMSITVIDSVNNIYWQSMDNDGLPLKKEQFADITVNGSSVGVAFNELFLKRMDNVDQAKVSVNIQ